MAGPMDAERLAFYREEADDEDLEVGGGLGYWDADGVSGALKELLADRDWHRARVQVTDENIDPDRAIAWVKAQPHLRYVVEVGIYAKTEDGEQLILIAEDELCDESWRGVTGRRFVPFDAAAINAIAAALGLPPLDVLDEIAAQELPT